MAELDGGVLDSARMADVAEIETRAYKESAVLPVPKLAGYVLNTAGQRLAAVGVGLKDARPVRSWHEGGEIRAENDQRLRLLYRVTKTVATVYDAATARAFLRSSSPYLNDASPIVAIATGDDVAVLEALRAFLEG